MKTVTKLKISIEGFKIRLDQVEEKIRELKDRPGEIFQSEEQKEKRMKIVKIV